MNCDAVGEAYFSASGATCERCDDVFGVSEAFPSGTLPLDDRSGCAACPANTIGAEGQCVSLCAFLSCANTTMSPQNSGETTVALDGMETLCTDAQGWAGEKAGRTVSAVIAALYDASEPLSAPVPRVYDATTPNGIQCAVDGDVPCKSAKASAKQVRASERQFGWWLRTSPSAHRGG